MCRKAGPSHPSPLRFRGRPASHSANHKMTTTFLHDLVTPIQIHKRVPKYNHFYKAHIKYYVLKYTIFKQFTNTNCKVTLYLLTIRNNTIIFIRLI